MPYRSFKFFTICSQISFSHISPWSPFLSLVYSSELAYGSNVNLDVVSNRLWLFYDTAEWLIYLYAMSISKIANIPIKNVENASLHGYGMVWYQKRNRKGRHKLETSNWFAQWDIIKAENHRSLRSHPLGIPIHHHPHSIIAKIIVTHNKYANGTQNTYSSVWVYLGDSVSFYSEE